MLSTMTQQGVERFVRIQCIFSYACMIKENAYFMPREGDSREGIERDKLSRGKDN